MGDPNVRREHKVKIGNTKKKLTLSAAIFENDVRLPKSDQEKKTNLFTGHTHTDIHTEAFHKSISHTDPIIRDPFVPRLRQMLLVVVTLVTLFFGCVIFSALSAASAY